MKDNRELKVCKNCNLFKLPRMHHCSQCNACCVKYDHHCGMVMNCIGINNYHIFLQFMILVFSYETTGALLNLYYNFYIDFRYESGYMYGVFTMSLLALITQVGSAVYSFTMLNWYSGMTTRNMHAVEESMAGNTYTKASFWGLTGDMKKKDPTKAPVPCKEDYSKRIYLYTKRSRFENM